MIQHVMGNKGYIFVGVLVGPFALDIVETHDLDSLKYINLFALAYITTSAGAELIVSEFQFNLLTLDFLAYNVLFRIFTSILKGGHELRACNAVE